MVSKKITGLWAEKEPENQQSATLLSFALDWVAELPFSQKRDFLQSYKEQFEMLAEEEGFQTAKIGFAHIGRGDCILNICVLDQDFPKDKTINDITSLLIDMSGPTIYTKCERIEYNSDTEQSLTASQNIPEEEPFNLVSGESQHYFKVTINQNEHNL